MGPRANQLKMELNNHMQRLRRQSDWSGQALFSGSLVSFPDSMHWHPRVAKYTYIYDMQLLVIWRIPLLAVVLHLSLALCVGQLQRLPTSPCLSRFRNDHLERRTSCTFQPSWFASWTWLHYDETTDDVLCHLCTKAVCEKKMKPGNVDVAFVS